MQPLGFNTVNMNTTGMAFSAKGDEKEARRRFTASPQTYGSLEAARKEVAAEKK